MAYDLMRSKKGSFNIGDLTNNSIGLVVYLTMAVVLIPLILVAVTNIGGISGIGLSTLFTGGVVGILVGAGIFFVIWAGIRKMTGMKK